MSGGDIICQGWLRKSPPEKKLRRYAWKKRWFILRSGRMSGDSDVLEYYKHEQSKKPLRIIDLHGCEQVDAGLTFKRKEFQDSFVFDIKTADRTFYLVAETQDDMNRWVCCICQLCGFNQSEDGNHELMEGRGCHSSQPLLFSLEPLQPLSSPLSHSAPLQDYLFLHQCISRHSHSARSASFSQSSRRSVFAGSDTPIQRHAHCLSGGQHGFYSLPKPAYPRGHASDPEDAYQTPSSSALDNYQQPASASSAYQIPRSFDKNHNDSSSSSSVAPPRPPKPSPHSEAQWAGLNGEASIIPRRNTLPAVENVKLHRGASFENSCHQRFTFFNEAPCVENMDGFNSYLKAAASLSRSDSVSSEDNYVPMNSSPLHAALADTPNYIPMSPGAQHFHFPGSSATLPARMGSSAPPALRPARLSDVTPPPINRNLKPNRAAKPTPLDLRNNGIIDELPFKSPVTTSWTRPVHIVNVPSQHCRPISTQSITSTDSADSEENYVAMQNPVSTSPAMSGTSSPGPKSCGNVDYLALDFQPGTPGPHRKPSTSSVTSDEKVDYVQVDKEKTQALQNTMQEWTDVRQSSEPIKAVKS